MFCGSLPCDYGEQKASHRFDAAIPSTVVPRSTTCSRDGDVLIAADVRQ